MSKTIIEIGPPSRSPWIDLREIWRYRDLFYYLVRRDIRVRYAQSVLGVAWAVVQPVFSMIVFTIVFGGLAKIESDGRPYALFSLAALVPWTYFANTLDASAGSLVSASSMLTKVYFPRLVLPLAPALSKLVDFGISFVLLFALMAWYRVPPTLGALFVPGLVAIMVLTAVGLGAWLASLAVRYRDVRYAMGFVIQLLMYATPVVYPASLVPSAYRGLYALNPMVGVIEGFRSALLATNPMPWDLIALGALSASFLAFSGALYFRRVEATFADVV